MISGSTKYRHHFHSAKRRALIAAAIVVSIMTIGTIGMHVTEGVKYIDAFYFMSMIATAQGSATTPVTVAGKIFASLMAFLICWRGHHEFRISLRASAGQALSHRPAEF